VYDVSGLTAAHPTMPLPSYARVTNLTNGRSIVVRVNDRGPFAQGRIIDVSERVAGLLGFQDDGTAQVKVDYVGPAQMDGQDERKLMASYRAPDLGHTMFASNFTLPKMQTPTFAPQPPIQQQPTVVLASATSRPKPSFATAYQASATAAPMMIEPAVAQQPDAFSPDAGDPLAPLIMQSGSISSYASSDEPTGAQQAADVLAQPNALQAALNRAAARKAIELGATRPAATIAAPAPAGPVIQLGSFADPGNAKRLAANFTRFGQVETVAQVQNGRSLTLVRVAVDPAVPQSAVIAAAEQAGLNGAFVLNQ
jgi:rare lipoprotein A